MHTVAKTEKAEGLGFFQGNKIGSGGWIWTNDLRVMSPTSYQTALPRSTDVYYSILIFFVKTIVENRYSPLIFISFFPDGNLMILYLKKTLTLRDCKKYN